MRGKVGGCDARGLRAHLKGCRVQPGSSCGERPGNVERKEEVEVGTERVVQPRP